MLQNYMRRVLRYRKSQKEKSKTDYGTYSFSAKEWILYLGQAIGIIGVLGFFFYHSWEMTILLIPLIVVIMKQKRRELCKKRKTELINQFKDMMTGVDNSLQAGYSLENAFTEAYKDMVYYYKEESVIVRELSYIRKGVRNGYQLEELLMELGERSGIEDIYDFANVLAVSKKSGGHMNEIIKSGISVIEEKIETMQEIQTILSSKKLEAKIMSGIPFFIILYIGITSKGYFEPLYQSLGGKIFMTVCLIIYLVAVRLARKITEIEF